MAGQIHDRDEASMAEQVLCMAITMGSMGKRSSAGAVPDLTHIVLEDFILRERTSDRSLLSPVRLNAKLEDKFRESMPRVELTLQSPSNAKTTVTNERLKRWGLWSVGEQHARDATRHLILWLRKNRALWE
jgi:hypothetical protein